MLNLLLQKVQSQTLKLCYQSVRFRGKYNSRYPRPRHDIARYLEEITRPVIVKTIPDQVDSCNGYHDKVNQFLKKDTKSAIDYEIFLAKYLGKLIDDHECMVICHQHFGQEYALRLNKIQLKKNSMQLWNFNTIIMKLFMENNPKYQNLAPIVDSALGRNAYIFVKTISELPKLLQLLRKMPLLVPLGGLVTRDHLLTKAELQRISELTDMTELNGGLVSALNLNIHENLSILQNPLMNLVHTFQSLSKKDEQKP